MCVIWQILSILFIFRYANVHGYISKILIWDKYEQEFIPFHNISEFFAISTESDETTTSIENINFNREILKASYFEEKNMVVFYDNDTKISGICGDIWNLIADHLNFTLVPIKYTERNFGVKLSNDTYTGLMGELYRNEIQVILRTGLYRFRFDVVDYTVPVWKTGYQLYIRPEYKYDNKWIITLFSRQTWFAVLFLFVTLGVTGYWLQKVEARKETRIMKPNENYDLFDHMFYTFAIMCSQGYIPTSFHNKFKILSISKSFFAWLTLIAFSSHLIYRMTNRTLSPPFDDIESLLNSTKYTILAFRGSMVFESFEKMIDASMRKMNVGLKEDVDLDDRVRYVPTVGDMYRKVCYSRKMYAMFEVGDKFMASDKFSCRLMPAGRSYYETWVGFAVMKGFRYKKAIDNSLVKLHEVGLVDGLKDRWLNARLENRNSNTFKTLDLEQIYLILMVLDAGIILSFVVLLLEHIVFFYQKKFK